MHDLSSLLPRLGRATGGLALACLALLALAPESGGQRRRPAEPPRKAPRARLEGHDDSIARLAFSPNGTLLASSAYDRTLRLWDVKKGKQLAVFDELSLGVASFAFTPDGKHLVAVGPLARTHEVRVVVYDVPARKALRRFAPRKGSGAPVAVTPDGTTVVLGGRPATSLVELATGKEISTLPGGFLLAMALSPDGKRLAASNIDGSLPLWGLPGRRALRPLSLKPAPSCLAFSPDSKQLAAGTYGNVTVWSLGDKPEVKHRIPLALSTLNADALAWSPDGKLLAVGGQRPRILLWDLAAGKPRDDWTVDARQIYALAFSPDGRTLASGGSRDKTISLWDVPPPKTPKK
jgi:WD40 repeat protein